MLRKVERWSGEKALKERWKGEKRETSTQNLQRNVARQVEGFCISYFAAFSLDKIFTQLVSCVKKDTLF